MQIRCSIQLGTAQKKLVLVSQENETLEQLALKLAGYILFFDLRPLVDVQAKNPAISQQEFRPDLLCLDEAGEIRLWLECGNVTTHKLDKLIRRNRQARIAVLKATLREAGNLRRAFAKNDILHSERVEIYAFPEGAFAEWVQAMSDAVEIIGEPARNGFNLVANSVPFSFDFLTA